MTPRQMRGDTGLPSCDSHVLRLRHGRARGARGLLCPEGALGFLHVPTLCSAPRKLLVASRTWWADWEGKEPGCCSAAGPQVVEEGEGAMKCLKFISLCDAGQVS